MNILFFLLFLFSTSIVHADLVVEPADMASILKKIEAHSEQAPASSQAARIVIKDGQVSFVQKPGSVDIATTFSDKSPTVVKQIYLKNPTNDDDYSFTAVLENLGAPYQHEVKKIRGQDALVFFNDSNVFVYTQTAAANGAIELKEWIYARKPNSPKGSLWRWRFESVEGQWPLTLGMGPSGEAAVYRNLPISGIPIAMKARSQYILDAMVKFSNNDSVEHYFPFHEIVSAIPPSQFWNVEGVERQANISIKNSSVLNPNKPKGNGDTNFFQDWDKYWQSFFNVSVPARAEEYPLLIDPSLEIVILNSHCHPERNEGS